MIRNTSQEMQKLLHNNTALGAYPIDFAQQNEHLTTERQENNKPCIFHQLCANIPIRGDL